MHIRRTDKVGVEASFHSLDEYMQHVETYYNQREHREGEMIRKVYLATDDPSVLNDAIKRFVYIYLLCSFVRKSLYLAASSTPQSN